MKTFVRILLLLVLPAFVMAGDAAGPVVPAVVHKSGVEVRAAPDLGAASVLRLRRDAQVDVAAQEGLWYRLRLDEGRNGYVRVNEVRLVRSEARTGDAGRHLLFSGSAGKGRVTETATVRGLGEGDFAGGRHNAAALARMESYRVDADTAEAHAQAQGWRARQVPWSNEAGELDASGRQATQAEKRRRLSTARSVLSSLAGDALGNRRIERMADRAIGKSDHEIAEEERSLGPAVAGSMLGVAPLWSDEEAQRRVNLVGRWLASQTSRPQLPWTFGVVDDGEINAYAAPGGYVLLTRGLYELLHDDAELAAVIAHEIGHVVQRDHFEVIRRQQVREAGKDAVLSEVRVAGAAASALAYVDRHGASVLLTGLDREAEYRADVAAGIYLERGGFDALAFYSVLQKLAALETGSQQLGQLHRTHPPLNARMDRLDRRGN